MEEESGNSALLLHLVDTTCAVIAGESRQTARRRVALVISPETTQMSVFQRRIFEGLSLQIAAQNPKKSNHQARNKNSPQSSIDQLRWR